MQIYPDELLAGVLPALLLRNVAFHWGLTDAETSRLQQWPDDCSLSWPQITTRRWRDTEPINSRLRQVEVDVIDPDAAGRALTAGRLACPEPGCTGRLRPWSKARPRPVRALDGQVQMLRPDRGRCRGCAVTQVLLPALCLPRRGYRIEVIGTALLAAADGAGYTAAAAACTAPASTVRDWIRAARRNAPALIGHAARLRQATADPTDPWPTPSTPPTPVPALTAALSAVGDAARAVAAWLTRPEATAAGHLTGIDYLHLLTRQYRHELVGRLRLGDPTSAPHATAWRLVTVITSGRLLTGVPD